MLLRRLLSHPEHQEATRLTSSLAELGVRVREMPYHDVVFGTQASLVGEVAVTTTPPATPAIGR